MIKPDAIGTEEYATLTKLCQAVGRFDALLLSIRLALDRLRFDLISITSESEAQKPRDEVKLKTIALQDDIKKLRKSKIKYKKARYSTKDEIFNVYSRLKNLGLVIE